MYNKEPWWWKWAKTSQIQCGKVKNYLWEKGIQLSDGGKGMEKAELFDLCKKAAAVKQIKLLTLGCTTSAIFQSSRSASARSLASVALMSSFNRCFISCWFTNNFVRSRIPIWQVSSYFTNSIFKDHKICKNYLRFCVMWRSQRLLQKLFNECFPVVYWI